jgi:phosphatidate cytidylyltransferase
LAVVVTAVSALALVEYFQITLAKAPGSIRLALTLSAHAANILLMVAAQRELFEMIPGILMLHMLIAGIIGLYGFSRDSRTSSWVAMQVQGVLYIPLLLSTLIMIRSGPDGIVWIYFLLAVVFAGDIGALYAGTFLGKQNHRRIPGRDSGESDGRIGHSDMVSSRCLPHACCFSDPGHRRCRADRGLV